jgi:hypothetical protein
VKGIEILAFFEDCSLRRSAASLKGHHSGRSLCVTSKAVNKNRMNQSALSVPFDWRIRQKDPFI